MQRFKAQGQDQHRERRRGNVRTHQRAEWAHHHHAHQRIGSTTLRGPGCLWGTALALLLSGKLGLPPQCNVVLVTAICCLESALFKGGRVAENKYLHIAYGSAWLPLPAAA